VGGGAASPPKPPAKAPTAQNKTQATAQATTKTPTTVKPSIAPGTPAPENTANAATAPRSSHAKITPPGEKSYTPPPADRQPPRRQVDAAVKSAPAKVSTSGHYRSPVTHHVYVYHDSGYYGSPGYLLDLYDPYNPYNYYSNVWSPFYGRPFILVDRCG
jgi:hypothetical protein